MRGVPIRSSFQNLLALLALLALPSLASAQTPPLRQDFPADGEFTAITCLNPTEEPSSDSCADEASDHRNIIGGGTSPAYWTANDGTYFYVRIRLMDDPRQGGALKPFGWGFGLDNDLDGEFEAYISVIGQGNSDRVEILDQDADNGTTPDLSDANGTALTPIDTPTLVADEAPTDPTWVTVTETGEDFCAGDTGGSDYLLTTAVPLSVLRDFGALGSLVAYGGSSSNFSGIQNDYVCVDGDPASCTTADDCPSGVCLLGEGACGPPINSVSTGCLDEDASPSDGIDDGCDATTPFCVNLGSGNECVACEADGDCDDSNECTTDTCASNACTFTSLSTGDACATGVCDGAASDPSCVACVDDASGATQDTGCEAETSVCDTSGAAPVCGECIDDAAGTTQDTGCEAETPVCDTSGAAPVCVECDTDADCDDSNECTADVCTAGVCSNDSEAAGTTCTSGVCDGAASGPTCVACVDDQGAGNADSGCSSGTPVCTDVAGSPACVACEDDQAGATVDNGCDAGAPLCNGSNACVVCLDDQSGSADVGCSGATPVCDPAAGGGAGACVACEDDDAGTALGDTDFGCSADSPFCDAASDTCVACVIDANCDDANDCTSDTCSASGTCSSSDELLGTACGTDDTCDGAGTCADCVNTMSGQDPGCDASAPFCDAADNVAGVCVECLGNDDCGAGEYCSASNVCELGCDSDDDCATGICDEANTTCVTCIDSAAGSAADDGCTAPEAPVCDGALGSGMAGTACVECNADDQCTGVCSASNECVTCLDTAAGNAQDSGCEAATPVCETAVAGGSCVECMDDDGCSAGEFCNPAGACTPGCNSDDDCTAGTCDESSNTCVACLDSETGTGTDEGCSAGAPVCEGASGAGTVGSGCVECELDGQCGSNACDPASDTCVTCYDAGAGTDPGCDAGTPLCDTSVAGGACLECLGNDDCSLGEYCDSSGSCATGCDSDDDCATGVCDEANTTCVTCIDSTGGNGVDDGCSGATPACAASGGPGTAGLLCVECTDDGTCDGNVCDTGSNTCTTCTDTAAGAGVDSGCTAESPLCTATTGGPVCVQCLTNGDCSAGEYCDASGSCATGCDSDDDCATGVCDEANNTCVACIDSAAGAAMDEGCSAPSAPVCDGASASGQPGSACVQCNADDQCAGACAPATNTCVTCRDTAAGNGADQGCGGATPVCHTAVAGGSCVECADNSACADGEHCNAMGACAPGCDSDDDCDSGSCDGMAGVCDLCVDSEGGTDTDLGCDTATPVCAGASGSGNPGSSCVVCEVDAQCAGGACDPSSRVCVPCRAAGPGTDPGCGSDLPMCDEQRMGGTCVECLADSDCGGAATCAADGRCQSGDSDGDGIPDVDECPDAMSCPDSDMDGVPDQEDPDDDGDGVPTADECSDASDCEDSDGDGTPDYLDPDDDGDGEPTAEECSNANDCEDTDDDGQPDYRDVDDDGDGVPTAEECSDASDCEDTDGDGVPDFRDVDDDGDGVPTVEEPSDADGDGTPDRLQVSGPLSGGYRGGAGCSTAAQTPAAVAWPVALVLALFWRRRRWA